MDSERTFCLEGRLPGVCLYPIDRQTLGFDYVAPLRMTHGRCSPAALAAVRDEGELVAGYNALAEAAVALALGPAGFGRAAARLLGEPRAKETSRKSYRS